MRIALVSFLSRFFAYLQLLLLLLKLQLLLLLKSLLLLLLILFFNLLTVLVTQILPDTDIPF